MLRAVLLVLAALALLAEPPPVRVAVDLSLLSAEDYAALDGLQLERSAVTRLVQNGFAVVSADRQPEIAVQVWATAEVVRLVAGPSEATVERRGEADRAALLLEIVQKLTALVRVEASRLEAARGRLPEARTPTVAAPPAASATAAPSRPPAPATPIGLGARAGIVARSGGVDPAVSFFARVGEALLARGEMSLAYAPGRELQAMDVWLSAGAGYRLSLTPWLELETSALAGLLIHGYALREGDDRGLRADLQASLLVGLQAEPRPYLRLGIWVSPGFSGRSREHVQGAELLWKRGALFLGASAGATVDF